MIDEIEQKIINILPTSNTMFDEIDYSILEKGKKTGLNFQKLRIVLYWCLIATLINLFLFLTIFLNYMELIPAGCLLTDIGRL